MTSKEQARAGVYVRLSKDREGLALGVERQEQDCRTLAERRGWEVAGVYSDNDLSATTGKARPSWERLLRDLESGSIQAVVAYSSSRMYRRLRDLLPLLEAVKANPKVKIATVASGDVDLTTADGRMLANILASVDQAEAERIGERISRKMRELAETGQDKGGPRAFGYEPDRVTIRESEARLLRDAARDLLAGTVTLRGVATRWNEAGVVTPTGKTGTWSGVRVRQILTSPRVAGLRQSGRGKVLLDSTRNPVKAEWEPIVDEQTWLALRSKFGSGDGRTHGRERVHSLSGLVYCANDGARMEARPSWQRQPAAYVCRECGRRIGEQGLEDYVTAVVLPAAINDLWTRRENARIAAAKSDPEDAHRRHAELSEALVSLARDYYVRRSLTTEAFEATNTELTAELEQLGQRLASPVADPYEGWAERADDIHAEARDWSPSERHDRLEALGLRLDIDAGTAGRRGFDAERVRVTTGPPMSRTVFDASSGDGSEPEAGDSLAVRRSARTEVVEPGAIRGRRMRR